MIIANILRLKNLILLSIVIMLSNFILNNGKFIYDNNWLGFLFTFIGLLGFANISNNYEDIDVDFINNKYKYDNTINFKTKYGRIGLYTPLLISIIGLFLMQSIWITFIAFFYLLLILTYNYYLKKLPFVGNFIIALLFGLIPICLSLIYKNGINHLIIFLSSCIFIIHLVREMVKDLEDEKGDKINGYKTLQSILSNQTIQGICISLMLILIGMTFFIFNMSSYVIFIIKQSILVSVISYFLIIILMVSIVFILKKEWRKVSTQLKVAMYLGTFLIFIYARNYFI